MLGGVISFTIAYHLLLVIIYYRAYTPLTCPVLSFEHCKYRKKGNRMQVFLVKSCKDFSCYRAQYVLHADRLYDCEKKGDKTKAGTFRIPAHILCCKISKISRG